MFKGENTEIRVNDSYYSNGFNVHQGVAKDLDRDLLFTFTIVTIEDEVSDFTVKEIDEDGDIVDMSTSDMISLLALISSELHIHISM